MKVLINTPPLNYLGGVANHYKGLKDYFTIDVHYNYIGKRDNIPRVIVIPLDIIKFICKCILLRPDLIVLNPSLAKRAIFRDSIYLYLSKFFRIKTIVFIHGWNIELEKKISNNSQYFVNRFDKADCFLVLASDFKERMRVWGISKPIYLTTTKVDNKLLKNFDLKTKSYDQTILYVGRVIAEKGIFILLNAFKKIKKDFPEAQLIIAGNGEALECAKNLVSKENISNVLFKGFVTGKELADCFLQSDIYILPTSHGEGMPTSILEAMAFGLPVITRPVGGIIDFFENEKMGYLVDSLCSVDFAEKAVELLESQEKQEQISFYNHTYAIKIFLASEVAKSMEKIFLKILGDNQAEDE